MKLGDAGKRLIQGYETCRLKAYLPTPDDVWTIGWGHTHGVKEGDTCTQEEADAWFSEDVAWAEECVNRAVTAQLVQNEFDALVSLCFNIGCHAFSGSTLVKLLNDSDFDAAAKEFRRWNKQGGKELAGLTDRRMKEAKLFEEATA